MKFFSLLAADSDEEPSDSAVDGEDDGSDDDDTQDLVERTRGDLGSAIRSSASQATGKYSFHFVYLTGGLLTTLATLAEIIYCSVGSGSIAGSATFDSDPWALNTQERAARLIIRIQRRFTSHFGYLVRTDWQYQKNYLIAA